MDSDYPKMSNLLKIFLRTFENVAPGYSISFEKKLFIEIWSLHLK